MKNHVDCISEKCAEGRTKIRVYVNGTDISDCVQSVDFEGGSGEMSFIRLKCVAHKIVVGGEEDANVQS